MGKNILIIGAAGNVCIEVIKLLSKKDIKLRIACRNPEKAQHMNIPHAEISAFDYLHPESFQNLFEGIDNWLLVSPPAHLNLQHQIGKMVELAKKEGVKNVVNVSKLGIQDDKHPMRQTEQFIEDSGMHFTFLRTNTYMQNFNTYFRQSIVEEGAIRLPAGDARTSFLDIRDGGEAAEIELLKNQLENKTYQLTGKEALSLFDVAKLFTEELNRKIEYREVNEEEYRVMLKIDGWYDVSIDAAIDLCRFVKQGWNAIITSGIVDILGREPNTFRNYIRDYTENWAVPLEYTE